MITYIYSNAFLYIEFNVLHRQWRAINYGRPHRHTCSVLGHLVSRNIRKYLTTTYKITLTHSIYTLYSPRVHVRVDYNGSLTSLRHLGLVSGVACGRKGDNQRMRKEIPRAAGWAPAVEIVLSRQTMATFRVPSKISFLLATVNQAPSPALRMSNMVSHIHEEPW